MLRSSRRGGRSLRRHVVGLVVMAVAFLLAGSGPAYGASYANIDGYGSTWSQVIFEVWKADVYSSGISVTYTGVGSSTGRQYFASGTSDFAISEIPYNQEVGEYAPTRPYAYLPIVAGGTAFTYHVEQGGKNMTGIRLSGETIAKIFTNQITNWNDKQIAADNNGRSFPDLAIIPVVRSDGSGTTAQFTTWLAKQYPALWKAYYPTGTLTSYYPTQSGSRMLAQNGSDGIMNQIASTAGNGSIGYVEYSYPINKKYPVVKVKNASGYYVEPTQYNVAVALTKARINTDASSPMYLTQILDDVYANPDPRAYPLSSYSYMIIPTGDSTTESKMTTGKRQSLADLMFYSLCEGQSKAGAYGYSPLPLNLVQAGFEQLAKLHAADPAVDLKNRDVTKCNNPTFVAGDLAANHLADIAEMPPECDKDGAGPCAATGGTGGSNGGTGGGTDGAGGTSGGSSAGGGASSGGGGDAATSGDAAEGVVGSDGVVYDPETGLAVNTGGDDGTGSTVADGPVSTSMSARQRGDNPLFGAFAALEIAAIVLVPGLLALWSRRKAVR